MTAQQPPARRGRPLDLEARHRALQTAGQMLREGGYAALTMDALARRAGVSKKSLYSWWPNKAAIAGDALTVGAEVLALPDLGDSREELLVLFRHARTYSDADHLPIILTAEQAEADRVAVTQAYLHRLVLPRREAGRALVQRCIARGDLPADTDVDALIDLWSGIAVYRWSIRRVPLADHLIEQLVDMALDGSVPRLA
ncbi:TetR/AcrR family transcriptional regulator [Streptomyces sp. NPDC048430]|uniref:TetR/AcrR family transcriptional regulator n=1 Tax=Streptomyces sp. NPDC048430 TaxID=3155388 RepID=UPI003429FDE8